MEIKYTKNKMEELEVGDVDIGSTIKITSGTHSGKIALLTGEGNKYVACAVELADQFPVINLNMDTKAIVIESTLTLDI